MNSEKISHAQHLPAIYETSELVGETESGHRLNIRKDVFP